MTALLLTPPMPLPIKALRLIRAGGQFVHRKTSELARQLIAAAALSTIAVGAMIAATGHAGAADMPGQYVDDSRHLRVGACGQPEEIVTLYDAKGRPTVPARTPYYYCVTGTTLLPGEIPPPPEYCCH